MKSTAIPKEEQAFRKHVRALLISIVLALYFFGLFSLIGAIIAGVTTFSGVAFFGWIAGLIVLGYLTFSGLVKASLSFFMTCAERISDGIADGYYDTPEVTA